MSEELIVKSFPAHLKKRAVWWFVETYLQPSDFDLALSKSTHYAYILHDKDNNESHYHILLHYDNARTGHAVLKDFPPIQNTFCENVKSPISCYEYLIHFNDPDKYQYDRSCIISDNPIYWENLLPCARDRPKLDVPADFIEDLLYSEHIDFVEMAKKYGRDFIKNYKVYLEYRDLVRCEIKFRD